MAVHRRTGGDVAAADIGAADIDAAMSAAWGSNVGDSNAAIFSCKRTCGGRCRQVEPRA